MKILLKWLLITAMLITGIYAVSPLWIPQLLKSQLPTDWEIEQLELGYPGIKGINIASLSLRGNTLLADIELSATQVRFNYRSGELKIGSLLLDVLLSAETNSNDSLSLDAVSLPLLQMPENMRLPEVLVGKMQVQLRGAEASSPLLLNFDSFNLVPSEQQRFQLTTGVSLVGYAQVGGQLEVETGLSEFRARLALSSVNASSPWFNINLEQKFHSLESRSELAFKFDAQAADRDWLNRLLQQLSVGWVEQIDGKMQLLASFSGETRQEIHQFSLALMQLQVQTADEKLKLDAELLGLSESGKIIITQGEVMALEYISNSSGGLLQLILPEFQRLGEVETAIDLRLNKLHIEAADITRLDEVSTSGLVELHWQEKNAFVYPTADTKLRADSLEVEMIGNLDINPQRIRFESVTEVEVKMDQLQLDLISEESLTQITADSNHTRAKLGFSFPLDHTDPATEFKFDGSSDFEQVVIKLLEKGEVQTIVRAQKLPLVATFSPSSGQSLSSGQANLVDVEITLLSGAGEIISAEKLDLSWQQLDILTQTGSLAVDTRGFELKVDGESWQGFELSLKNRLHTQGKLSGSGKVLFSNGPSVPLEYQGDLLSGKWQATILPTTINTERLPTLLKIARIEWPVSLVPNAGHIEVSAEVIIADSIHTTATVRGNEIGFSVLENNFQGGSIDMQFELAEDLTLKGSVSLADLEIAGGLGVENIRAELLMINTDLLQAKQLQLQMFGGRLKPISLQYNAGLLANSELEFTDLDLQQLLSFADIDGLTGTGSLEIRLPVGSDSGGFYVRDATFSSSTQGHLAYLSGVPGSNIGLQALENFQYQSLSGTLDYQSDGNYQVLIRLNGSNPDLYGGHPISFNLTINGVLPELFEALFITGNFEEGIIKQINSQ